MSQSEIIAGIADTLVAIAETDRSEVTPDRTFTELGLDSLSTLEVIVALEDRFGMLIRDDDWPQFRTISDAARYIERAAVPSPSPNT